MDVRSIGTGAANVDAALRSAGAARPEQRALALAAPAGSPADTIAALLERLAVPGISDLILHLEDRRAAVDPGTLSELLRVAGAAALEGDLAGVRKAVSRIVTLNAEWIENIHNDPGLEPVRGDVQALLAHLVAEVRIRAEGLLQDAALGVETAAPKLRSADLRDAGTVLALANQLYESGRHIDYVRAAELAQVLLLHFPVNVPPPALLESQPLRRSVRGAGFLAAARQVARWWKRAPVLVLLGGWVALGCVAAFLSIALRELWPDFWNPLLAAGIWAAGFLAFVAYIRVRSLRL